MLKVDKTQRQLKMVSGEGYCRKCQKTMSLNKFYEATNPMLDSNGFMSVCRECCNNLYSEYFSIYNNTEMALDLTCRDLDVRFNKQALEQAQSHIESLITKGKKAESVFGYYKSKLGSTGKNNERLDSFRYKDGDIIEQKNNNNTNDTTTSFNENIDESYINYWGKNKEEWEYDFLENELYRLKADFECSDYGMEMIMKDICFTNLDIERIRQGCDKGDVAKLIESRSKLMNDGNLKPVQATGADKNEKLSLGVFIKKWENEKPVTRTVDDEMKKYIDTYMVGHLAKMEGLNNDLVKQYEEAIKEYTIDFSEVNSEEYEE